MYTKTKEIRETNGQQEKSTIYFIQCRGIHVVQFKVNWKSFFRQYEIDDNYDRTIMFLLKILTDYPRV